jgi:hypothetical protein
MNRILDTPGVLPSGRCKVVDGYTHQVGVLRYYPLASLALNLS